MEYKIGQILTSKEDQEIEKVFGENEIIPNGNKVIIGADKFAHHIRNGFIQSLGENVEVKGYDAAGIAEYLYMYLKNSFAIDEMLEDYSDNNKQEFIDEIEFALEEIGF